jgi:hypothetical protein
MELEFLENIQPDAWDKKILHFDTKFLFHQSDWLKFLEETQKGKTVRFKIIDNGKVEGYFVGLIIKKGPIKILGSPLSGWTTNYMGPIVNKGFDVEKFLITLEDLCRQWRIHHIELCNPVLDHDIMHKMGFHISEGITHIIPLSLDENQMWKRLHRTKCRQAINRAKRNGLIVKENYDASFIDEYYQELREVFSKQGLVPTYGIERVRSLFKNLKPDLFFALQVEHKNKIIATGIFPHDDRSVVGFGAASWKKYQGLNPNELLWWEVMTIAAEMGLKQLDMSGKGSFKPKFGAEKVPVYRYSKSYSIFAKTGREVYKFIFYAKQKIKGKFSRTTLSK